MNTKQLANAIYDVMAEWNEDDCSDADAVIRVQALLDQWDMEASV